MVTSQQASKLKTKNKYLGPDHGRKLTKFCTKVQCRLLLSTSKEIILPMGENSPNLTEMSNPMPDPMYYQIFV